MEARKIEVSGCWELQVREGLEHSDVILPGRGISPVLRLQLDIMLRKRKVPE